jgi:phosphopantetheinyl transferase
MDLNKIIKQIPHKNILYIEINNVFVNNYNILVNFFCNKKDLIRINKYVFEIDKQRHLASIILQKYITKEFTELNTSQTKYSDLIIYRNKYNKPFIFDKLINYNISHDNSLVVANYDLKMEVGIDIMSKDKEKIVKEIKILKNKTEEDINDLVLWTLFESYYKLNGNEMSYLNDREFYVKKDNNKYQIYKTNNELKENIIIDSFNFMNYIISTCKRT